MEQKDRLPRYIQLESTLEFSRLVCALERAPRVSFLHEHEGQKVLSVQMDLLKEKPVIYYTPLEGQGHYLCYGFKSGKEESLVVDSTTDNSKLYSPIVKIKSLPENLMAGNGTQRQSRRSRDGSGRSRSRRLSVRSQAGWRRRCGIGLGPVSRHVDRPDGRG